MNVEKKGELSRLLTSSVLGEFHELVGSLSLVVTGLGCAGGVEKLLSAHGHELFLDDQAFLDDSCVTQTLTHVCDFVVAWRIDLEAELARVVEAPVADLHVVTSSNCILARIGVLGESRGSCAGHEDRAAHVRALAGVVK